MFLLQLTKALDLHKVDYALVGGYAVALHGAVRGTLDVDLVLSLEKKSLIKAEQTFLELGLVSKLPVTAADVFEFRKEYIEKRNLVAWSFVDPNNPVHLLDIIITQDLKDIQTIRLKIQGVSVKVASISSLILMKQKSGRPQDLEDIKALQLIGER
jgi:predicted nucleotidyltransferase